MATVLILITFSACGEDKVAGEQQSEQLVPPPPPPSPPPPPGTRSNEPLPYDVVDVMPQYPGGDSTLLNYIADNAKYPEAAKQQKIQGKVVIRFCVTEKGDVDKISVLRGVYPDLDTEAIRVVKTLSTFKPGEKGGKAVPVWYVLPITFELR